MAALGQSQKDSDQQQCRTAVLMNENVTVTQVDEFKYLSLIVDRN